MLPNHGYQAQVNYQFGGRSQQSNAAYQATDADVGSPFAASQIADRPQVGVPPAMAQAPTLPGQQPLGDYSQYRSPHNSYGSQTRVGQLPGSANNSMPGTPTVHMNGGQGNGQGNGQVNGQGSGPVNYQNNGQVNGQTNMPNQQYEAYRRGGGGSGQY